ncbi:MAG TPA: class I SAM-dependent methyltransferase [Solirubrobacterales bacterium]|nr:class I SAM-dependent methyltransferase [Solirubrobacterales bacterium]
MGMAVWHNRDEWLSLLEDLFDPTTTSRLEGVGVRPGWHVLEVGAGRGSIAGWLAERVGESGRVVATDIDTTLLDQLQEPRLEVLRHDVLADDFPAASFDLVHCRAVLVHVGDPHRALERIAEWLKPGGVLVAEEPWTDVARLAPDPVVAKAAEALGETLDGGFARRLPPVLREIGLERVEASADVRFFDGGSGEAAFIRRVLEGACARLVAAGRLDPSEVRGLQDRFADPSFCDCGWPRIGAIGWKPGA